MDWKLGALALLSIASFGLKAQSHNETAQEALEEAATAVSSYSACMTGAVARFSTRTESTSEAVSAAKSTCRKLRSEAYSATVMDSILNGRTANPEAIANSVLDGIDEEAAEDAVRLKLERRL